MTEKKKRTGRQENLVPLTTEKAREIGKKGGVASGLAKKEKKLMSAIYAEFLAAEYNIQLEDGSTKKVSGTDMVNQVMKKVLARGDGASVGMLREIREATEGSRSTVDVVSTEEATKEIFNIFGTAMKEHVDK